MIPKIISFYWGGQPLSYLQYLTVVSFKKHNPDWKVNLFVPKTPNLIDIVWTSPEQSTPYTGKDYLDEVKKLCNVREVNFENLDAEKLHEVHRSDLLRWKVLFEEGGVWSDMDILYIKPLLTIKAKTAVVYDGQHHIIGFYITEPKQEIFSRFYNSAFEQVIFNRAYKYQVLGSTMIKKLFENFRTLQTMYPEVKNLPTHTVYPYSSRDKDIREMFFTSTNKVHSDTIGIHWYNGSIQAKKYQNEFDKYKNNGSVISEYVREYV